MEEVERFDEISLEELADGIVVFAYCLIPLAISSDSFSFPARRAPSVLASIRRAIL
jgi:hypothetical protein